MQKTALSIVYEGVALQLQRNMVIDTLFVNTYTIDLILKHRHPDRLQNFSRYMSSIIQFVAELLLIIPNFVGQLKVKQLHQDTTNITFICPHAHLRILFQRLGVTEKGGIKSISSQPTVCSPRIHVCGGKIVYDMRSYWR